MVRDTIQLDVLRGRCRVVRWTATLRVPITLLVPLFRLMPQPEVIGDHQSNRHHGNTNDQHQTLALHLAPLRGVLRGAFGLSGGFFG